MTLACGDFERMTDARSDVAREERESWERHVAACERCRRQAAVDQVLRASLGASPPLRFSEEFDRTLSRRLAERRERRPIGRAARLALGGYAVLASALSVMILAGIEWPRTGIASAGAVGLLVLALASPLVLLPGASPLAPPACR